MAKRVFSCGLDPSLSMIRGVEIFHTLASGTQPLSIRGSSTLGRPHSETMLIQELKEMITTARGALSPFILAPETPARRSCHRDKTDHVHPVPKRLSVRA